MKRFEWVEAKTAQDALKQPVKTVADVMLAEKATKGAAVIKAGGVDVLDLMKENILYAPRVVNIRLMENMHNVSFEKKRGMVIGPLVTLATIAENKDIQERYRALSDAASHIATPNIRNAATVGGNLLQRPRCWYFRSEEFDCVKKGGKDGCLAIEGDNKYHAVLGNQKCAVVHPSTAAVALVALGASIELTSSKGTKSILLEDFFVAPEKDATRENILADNELVTAIIIPDTEFKSAHIKMGEKDSFDWSTGDCAVALEMTGDKCKSASIILGAAAPVPYRAKAAEEFLKGKSINEETAREAAKLALKDAKPLSHNGYKIPMLEAATKRALLRAMK